MKAGNLQTTNPAIELVEPNIVRDAETSVTWINGALGHETMRLMGVPDKHNTSTTLQKEQERIQDFIVNPNHLNWTISVDAKIVGAIWVDLKDSEYVKSPSIHIMIGDATVRKKGIGTVTINSVIAYLTKQGHKIIYSRHLVINNASQHLLANVGFTPDGNDYTDNDDLRWQNVILSF